MEFSFQVARPAQSGKRVVCGVVGSGNLEVIIEKNQRPPTEFEIVTSVSGYQHIWKRVIEDFINKAQPAGLKFTINDAGATPAVVLLRLKQALELFHGYRKISHQYVELSARERIDAIVDPNSFTEWLADENSYSPHLSALEMPSQADDGIVIGQALFKHQSVLIAAQCKDFMGGAVGEIHGAKLTGIFKAAIKQKVTAVILLIDSGGVRLHEANAGEIAISEIIRAIFAARDQGIKTIGVICGKNGAFGGMGIISACLDVVIMNEIARVGVSGPEVIQAVQGIEAFDAQDRRLIWRVYGGKTRYLQGFASEYVSSSIEGIQESLQQAMTQACALDLNIQALKKQHQCLKARLVNAGSCQEEGEYLQENFPKIADVFEMNTDHFLKVAPQMMKRS